MIQSICVYCGSSPGANPDFERDAVALGQAMAKRDLSLVYGGGDKGLMGAVARGVLRNGAAVTGIIPSFLADSEQPNGAIDLGGAEMIVVPDMHTRKHMMFEKADAFIALPGGIGTLEELIEMQTWAQLARHEKPIGVLNTGNFWAPLLALLGQMEEMGFLHQPHRTRLSVSDDVEQLLDQLISAGS